MRLNRRVAQTSSASAPFGHRGRRAAEALAGSGARLRDSLRCLRPRALRCPRRPAPDRASGGHRRSDMVWCAHAPRTVSSGKVNVKHEPAPGSLVTATCPPMSSTSCRTMESPSPVPPKWRVVDASACSKGSNRREIVSGAMPMPVSRTSNPSRDRPLCWPTANTFDRHAAFAT